ncbi:DNA repair protein RecO [Formosa algae]|jgi:DNA repair protein RecO (recombination protein O)|uniref:DNA repair protein RecO n=1 Tax=Formosa algae TaxID=225843 RepID=A0A9X0YNA3_9FLAO|nr:DNA repair protein RecO [Formosa algae]MBP1840357.1 DNA repair protein RecO (recombination protein O) [Formosa algae]MDQ0334221.1 DNA repair protein RecO (recombination protein O) [Formosa algae]OEI82214.1 DNA repair protein RecO [Formosa algae]PNW29552.1 DNA repair protein RecO [Formosa algae]
MFNSSSAIVLSKLKYRDNDLIVSCYTKDFGVVSFLLRGVFKSRKGKARVAYFQLLSQIQIEADFKKNRSLQTLKDVKLNVLYSTLHTQVVKSAIVMFLADVLAMVLKEEEGDAELFEFLENAFMVLDETSESANFHLVFLVHLTKYLGCAPDTTNSDYNYFNLSTGQFEKYATGIYSISGDNLKYLKSSLGIIFDDLGTMKMNSKQRQSFLDMLLLYYELHLGQFRKPKSLAIFSQVFN